MPEIAVAIKPQTHRADAATAGAACRCAAAPAPKTPALAGGAKTSLATKAARFRRQIRPRCWALASVSTPLLESN